MFFVTQLDDYFGNSHFVRDFSTWPPVYVPFIRTKHLSWDVAFINKSITFLCLTFWCIAPYLIFPDFPGHISSLRELIVQEMFIDSAQIGVTIVGTAGSHILDCCLGVGAQIWTISFHWIIRNNFQLILLLLGGSIIFQIKSIVITFLNCSCCYHNACSFMII